MSPQGPLYDEDASDRTPSAPPRLGRGDRVSETWYRRRPQVRVHDQIRVLRSSDILNNSRQALPPPTVMCLWAPTFPQLLLSRPLPNSCQCLLDRFVFYL